MNYDKSDFYTSHAESRFKVFSKTSIQERRFYPPPISLLLTFITSILFILMSTNLKQIYFNISAYCFAK